MPATTLRWETPSTRTAHHLQAIFVRLESQSEELVDRMVQAILASSPVLARDPVLTHSTRASTEANVRRIIGATVARPQEPVAVDAPPEAIDLARDLVRRGADRSALLTAYRQGQNVMWRHVMATAQSEDLDVPDLVALLDFASRSLFGYVDGVLQELMTTMDAERDEVAGGALARRRETVQLILDDAPISQQRASTMLGYELARRHTAVILWAAAGSVASGDLERACGALAGVLGARRPLTVPAGSAAVWCWMADVEWPDQAHRAIAAVLPEAIRVTIGDAHPGISGFRDSHREALDTQRLAMRTNDHPALTTYSEVRAASLAAQDEGRAIAFVGATLGQLAHADPELRETVRVYLKEDANAPRAAAVLHTHRNTVLKRLARADALLPEPLAGRGLEVRLALELARWLPSGRSRE
ncbi:helix-turn-helix domain-containing protein [Patulibacter brassicae]|uniref:Helix-turn-helix domain-containing protein n=1 Tax=Patulibacter brassicae TaxID=1705717 RepID=A0ABU4VH46_9ACTN|nr:helix-turn-helix domain-containing protein [Patulibacter brassicae]MDX8150707.1 helix-turn-helix domain-containing protein [Patulibacter brassicae]